MESWKTVFGSGGGTLEKSYRAGIAGFLEVPPALGRVQKGG